MATVVKVTNAGLAVLVNRIRGLGTEPKWGHWGETAASAADVLDTDLEDARTEEVRAEGSSSSQTTVVTNDTYRLVATLTAATNPAAIVEFGLFDASTVGNLFLRATFDVINVAVGDAVQFTVDVINAQV
jgi:hypothetical protein